MTKFYKRQSGPDEKPASRPAAMRHLLQEAELWRWPSILPLRHLGFLINRSILDVEHLVIVAGPHRLAFNKEEENPSTLFLFSRKETPQLFHSRAHRYFTLTCFSPLWNLFRNEKQIFFFLVYCGITGESFRMGKDKIQVQLRWMVINDR
jgi:hypothetical protein